MSCVGERAWRPAGSDDDATVLPDQRRTVDLASLYVQDTAAAGSGTGWPRASNVSAQNKELEPIASKSLGVFGHAGRSTTWACEPADRAIKTNGMAASTGRTVLA